VAEATRSRRTERRERELASRRAHAIEGASIVFAKKGYHDAQMVEIAAEAELSLGTLYSMFEGKEAIYQHVIRSAVEDIRRGVRARVDAVSDPVDKLFTLIDALFECFERNRDLLRIVLSGSYGLPWRIRENMSDSTNDILEGFTEWVTELCLAAGDDARVAALDPEILALSMIGSVNTAAARALDSESVRSLEREGAGVREIFRRALLGGSPP
jgi:AcrR family transcriptional regulator